MKTTLSLSGIILSVILSTLSFRALSQDTKQLRLLAAAGEQLKKMENIFPPWRHVGRIRVDSVALPAGMNLVRVFFTTPVSYIPVRETEVTMLENRVNKALGRRFRKYEVELYSGKQLFSELIPNSYRGSIPVDTNRMISTPSGRIPVVRQMSKEQPKSGLYNNNLAIWDSHGWYYESKLDRWEWQRARLFGTVEDMSTMSYVLPYLVPMLENSGAGVFLPRERDWQPNEVIVDNDYSTAGSELTIPEGLSVKKGPGFLLCDTLITGNNPFEMGTSLSLNSEELKDQTLRYVPSFNTKGRYSVSVAYQSHDASLPDVKYSVIHAGGKTDFLVNQRIGGGTWIYLGTFDFNQGKNPQSGMVTVSRYQQAGIISTDAIKFGGGMGNVARRPADESMPNKKSLTGAENPESETVNVNAQAFKYKLSGKARNLEAARYYLQSAGFPDTLIYNLNKDKNDYNDDYQSRGAWVNYLTGSKGVKTDQPVAGLNIPIDLAFAFHTDAGVTPDDSIIGTLGIYSTMGTGGLFPNGKSRMASRDLTDLIQTQLVDDIRSLYNPSWTRRGLWDKQYSEAWRPNVPAMLLELFSHQNIADMRFGLDPRFRFDVSRAIYKGILRFQSYQEHRPYIVHPLPVDHFAITQIGNDSVRLTWRPVTDPLEPTAKPTRYRVYQRIDDNGFDNGTTVEDSVYVLRPGQKDRIYSFKVTALNDGGESFASETLSVGIRNESKGNVLVVNAFDRICAPAVFDNGKEAGISWWKDQGVADRQDISFVGFQYDFDRKSKWLDDDSPGWGASYGDMEGKVIPGNTFDNPFIHGRAIMDAGYSFVSVSDEVFCSPVYDISPYFATDIILGEERSTAKLKDSSSFDYKIYTPEFMSKITRLTKDGGKLFISGAYIGSEFGESADSTVASFAKNILHFTWRTGHAVKGGGVYSTDYARKWLQGRWNFNVEYHPEIYTVEAPDGIEPFGKNAVTGLRYNENNVSAGIVFDGSYKVVALGFPFETITGRTGRTEIMQQIISFFESK